MEERGNGWSKISFEGQDAFIKTEFLEVASEEAVTEDNSTAQAEAEAAATDNQTETAQNQEETAPVATDSTGETVTVVENVNVRKSASESGEKLGLAYMGEKLEVIMKQADGWTRVKYNGQTGYVKSDYVE